MAVSPTARARAQADALARTREQKATYAARLREVQAFVEPPLSAAELSLGLGLGEREVGRFLSVSPHLAAARPDREVRALLDALLAGELVLAVARALPGARREVDVLAAVEARRLDRSWAVVSRGAPVGLRDHELETSDLWDLGVRAPGPRPARAPASRREFLGRSSHPLVLGTLRLGTAGRPETPDLLVAAALEAGIELFDTADSYGLDETDLGYAERLLGRALSGQTARVVTKAGLRRPGGKWVPDGSPARLRAACEASLRNLGVERLDTMLLHVVDPRVPLAESLGELARLKDEGKLAHLGVSNVSLAQLEAAAALAPIAVVQVELSRAHAGAMDVVSRAHDLGIAVMAHRPLGGHGRMGKPADAAVIEVAARHGTSTAQVELAWVLAAGPHVFPTFGATKLESIVDSAAAATLQLTAEDFTALDRGLPPRVTGDEVVLIAGPPAAGKTSRVAAYLARGFERLNRDERGGTIAGLLPPLKEGLAAGKRRWVLDNTFPTRESRRPFVDVAKAAGIATRCVSVEIGEGDALVNACHRMLDRRGRLLDPAEMQAESDPNLFPPQAIYRWFQTAEPPEPREGFTLERAPFVRRPGGSKRALLLDLDGTVRTTTTGAPFPRGPDEVVLLPGRRELLRRHHEEGWLLLGVSNQSGIARGDVTVEAVEAAFARTAELVGVPLPVRYCPHPSGTIRCWCRKPMPGLAVSWIRDHDVDVAASRFVGDMETDGDCAAHLGMPFSWATEFFTST